jgi:DNA-binding response OmpR family regulator
MWFVNNPMNKPVSILVVDDEPNILSAVEPILQAQGYHVTVARSAVEALKYTEQTIFDIVLTDLSMPMIDGFQMIEEIRRLRPDIGIILFSGNAQRSDLIEALHMRVDDFLEKPVTGKELKRAIGRTIARRTIAHQRQGTNALLTIGPLTINNNDKSAVWNGQPLGLTPTEFCLLRTLALSVNQIVSSAQLASACREDYMLSELEAMLLLKPHISNLRHKLEAVEPRRIIVNRRGVGFMLQIPLEQGLENPAIDNNY